MHPECRSLCALSVSKGQWPPVGCVRGERHAHIPVSHSEQGCDLMGHVLITQKSMYRWWTRSREIEDEGTAVPRAEVLVQGCWLLW